MNSTLFSIFKVGVWDNLSKDNVIDCLFRCFNSVNKTQTWEVRLQYYSLIVQISSWFGKEHGKPCKDMDHVCFVHCWNPIPSHCKRSVYWMTENVSDRRMNDLTGIKRMDLGVREKRWVERKAMIISKGHNKYEFPKWGVM